MRMYKISYFSNICKVHSRTLILYFVNISFILILHKVFNKTLARPKTDFSNDVSNKKVLIE